MSTQPAFDPYVLFEALDRERVSYVVVGGFARVIHGSAETTDGLDIVPSRTISRHVCRIGGATPHWPIR